MGIDQKEPQERRKLAERSLQLYLLAQQHGLPQTPQGCARFLSDAGYESVALRGHQRRASLLAANYSEILLFDPFVRAYVGTGSFLPEQDFHKILFNVFTHCYEAGKRAAEQGNKTVTEAAEIPATPPAPAFFRSPLPCVEEIVDDGEDGVPLLPEHGQAYDDAREQLGYPRRKL